MFRRQLRLCLCVYIAVCGMRHTFRLAFVNIMALSVICLRKAGGCECAWLLVPLLLCNHQLHVFTCI